MKKRSIPSFVLGLLAGLLVFVFGYVVTIVFGLVAGLSEEVGEIFVKFHSISSYLLYAGAILSILGSAFCFSKARVGGILLIIASILFLIFPVLNTYLVIIHFSIDSIFILLLTYIPFVFSFISSILAMNGRVRHQLIKEESINIES